MAKHNDKSSKHSKQKGAEKGPSEFTPKWTKPQKPKGPKADYTPNQERAEARHVQAENTLRHQMEKAREEALARAQADLARMEGYYPDLVAGIPGEYNVGFITEVETLAFWTYTVKEVELPLSEGMQTTSVTRIYGEGDVFVPLAWLFYAKEKINLLSGWRGEIQAKMLDFLREELAPEIEAAKAVHREQRLRATEVTGPKLVTVDGVNVGEPAVKPACNTIKHLKPLKDFNAETVGHFDFSCSGGNLCVVNQYVDKENGKMTLKVTKLDLGHPMAQQGVYEGIWMRSQSLQSSIPNAVRYQFGDEFFEHANLLREYIIERVQEAQANKTAAA